METQTSTFQRFENFDISKNTMFSHPQFVLYFQIIAIRKKFFFIFQSYFLSNVAFIFRACVLYLPIVQLWPIRYNNQNDGEYYNKYLMINNLYNNYLMIDSFKGKPFLHPQLPLGPSRPSQVKFHEVTKILFRNIYFMSHQNERKGTNGDQK